MNKSFPLVSSWFGLSGLAWVIAVNGPCHAAEVAVGTVKELTEAMKHAAPGDEVVLEMSTAHVWETGEWKDVELRVSGAGTAEAPITVRAAEPGKTVVTGASRLRLSGEHLIVSGLHFHNLSGADTDWVEFRYDSKNRANHCRLTECALTQDVDSQAAEKLNRWIGLYGSGNELDHCFIAGKRNRGATVVVWLGESDTGRHRLHHNHFGSREELGKNGGETIRIGDSESSMLTAACVVEQNLFEHCDGETECISNKSCGNVYRGNTFRAVRGTLTLRHGNECVVEGNVFIGDEAKQTGGVRVIGEGHRVEGNQFIGLTGDDFRSAFVLVNGVPDSPANGYLQVKNVEVIGNTFLNCKHPMLLGYNDEEEATLAPDGVLLRGNVIVSENEEPAIEVGLLPTGLKAEGNRVYAKTLGIAAQEGIEQDLGEAPLIAPLPVLKPDDVGPGWLSPR